MGGVAGMVERWCSQASTDPVKNRQPECRRVEDLAPVVNHCLDAFGPDRVFFGGDWPVCLLGSPVRGWVDALKQIVSSRPASEQRKLWSANAIKFYGLSV